MRDLTKFYKFFNLLKVTHLILCYSALTSLIGFFIGAIYTSISELISPLESNELVVLGFFCSIFIFFLICGVTILIMHLIEDNRKYLVIISFPIYTLCIIVVLTSAFLLESRQIFVDRQNILFSDNFKAKNAIYRDKNQLYFKCCGWNSSHDYLNFTFVPKSCCPKESQCLSFNDTYIMGCKEPIISYFTTNYDFLRIDFSLNLYFTTTICMLSNLLKIYK